MQERQDAKQKELDFLAEESKKNPELFRQRTFTEEENTLAEFGIYIPGKENFLSGTLKLWPEDFIVEEVGESGEVRTVQLEERFADSEGPTTYATLVKCGLSTIEAVDDIARALNVGKERISYAGIKDKDALTAQRISLRGIAPSVLRELKSASFFLKDIESGKGVVEKGKLRGNRFTVLIRTQRSLLEKENSQIVAQALESVHEKGFYNFFYLQRFGTPRLCNFRFALSIVRGQYEHAVFELLTHTSERELGYFKKLRETLKEQFGQWERIRDLLAPFPLIFSHERKVVEHLLDHPGDYAGALNTIPEQVTLWVYALSSFLFNQKISEYLERGMEPPAELPLFLSTRKEDWEPYREMLERLGIYPVPLGHLRPFPHVQVRSRRVHTKDRAKIRKGEVTPEGLLLEFELAKGQYATTFLSHLFNLTAGKPPETISQKRVDTKTLLKETSLAQTLAMFESVIRPKGEELL